MANWLYNGVELPELPEWDKEMYPYAMIFSTSASAYLRIGKSLVYRTTENGTWQFGLTDSQSSHLPVRSPQNGWSDFWRTGAYWENLSYKDQFWTNTDILNADGSVWLSASNPIRLDSKLSISVGVTTDGTVAVTFTCSNLNVTDSVYKIAAWCYPKGTSYLDAPHTYTSAANFPGKEHAENWALPALTEGTEYELYACIMVDDVATDHNALVTFTTNGMAELDFSNATLTVDTGMVQHNSYTFKLAYSGLPYNADGTSAVFDIVAVTDAGDRAYMGARITSGSGTVNGTFIDLEPLTDYTATFEVYYNGKPTGVTATASFTTEEEHVPGDMNRDSFPLGFASGLCGVPITETDAEYNTWAQGYIVGSALRKAL